MALAEQDKLNKLLTIETTAIHIATTFESPWSVDMVVCACLDGSNSGEYDGSACSVCRYNKMNILYEFMKQK